jgi:SAM-dependent methyltransferase
MERETLRRHYDAWHATALRRRTPEQAAAREAVFHDWLLARLEPAPGASILDVACGTGAFVAHARLAGLEATGTDVSAVALEAARAAVEEAEFVLADAQELPFPDESFDHVSCLGSLEHFPDPVQGAREMRRVLRADGRALIYVPNLFFLGHLYFGLVHGQQPTEGEQRFSETLRTAGGWRELLEEAGFRIGSVGTWNRMYATQRVPRPVKALWNAGSRFVPLNVSYAFAFVCTRA